MPEEQKSSMSKAKKDSLIARLKMDIDAANNYYEETVEPAVMERYDIYGAKKSFYRKMFPNLSKRCEIVSTDIQDVIESTMPSMMKAFFGSTDVVTVQGMDGTEEDEQRAEKMQALINYQLEKEQFFMTFYQWAKDALITNLGIIKVDWERLIEQEQQEIMLDPQAYEQMLATAGENNVQILSVEPVPEWGGYHVVYIGPMMKKNQPRIMNVLASEFRFSPDATSLETADFIAHRKIVTLDYLRKQEESGWYENVEEVAERAQEPHYTPLDEQNNENIDEEPNQSDTGRQKVELYECYVNINMSDNPDEKLTPMIITYSNGVILRMEANTYERHPFFCLSPRIDPHKIWPDSGFVDLIAQIQHAKTAILRQMIYSMAQSNDGKMGINLATLVDVNDVLENRQFVRVNGDVKEALMPIPMAPLQQWTFQMLEYLDNVKENRTGITRYNQGMDNNSLNKTATGINLILQQSNQRIELIARIFAETGLRELFKFLIKMNQLFINQETVIRLTNGPMVIRPDDLEGDFDLIVNAGMGAGQRQQNVQNLQVLQGLMTQLAQIGMVGNEEIYNFSKKYIEELGFKNVDDFVMSPDKAAQYQQMMAQQQQASQQAQESESVRAAITDAPWEVQMQFWQKKGFEATPDMFTNQAAQKVLETATQEEAKADVQRGDVNERIADSRAAAAGGARPQGGGSQGAASGIPGGGQGQSRGRIRPQQPPRPPSGDGAGTFSGLLGGR